MLGRPRTPLLVLSLAALTLAGCQDAGMPLAPAPRAPTRQLVQSLGAQLDQENLSVNSSAGTGPSYVGQSFTAGLGGTLTTVEFQITCQFNMSAAAAIEVYAGAYDVYSTDFASPPVSPTPIASQPVAASAWPSCYDNPFAPPTWVSVTFDTPASVVAGQQYTFRMKCGGCSGQINHPMSAVDVYAGGTAFVYQGYEMVFRTYVTASGPTFAFTGFFAPVDAAPTLNATKAGSAVPVKFSLGGDQGLAIFAAGSPASQSISCAVASPVDALEETVTAGASGLTYDALTDRYTYVWKTDKAWAGTCRTLSVTLTDGTTHTANFKFTK